MDESILTLVASRGLALTADHAAETRAGLARLGAETRPPDWLAQETACDIAFLGLDPDQADAAARYALSGLAIDVVAQPTAERRKKLLLADMESTLIANEMLDELAIFVGKQQEIAEITRRAMNGELDFEQALGARVGLLAGLPALRLDEAARRIRYTPGAYSLVQTMNRHGAKTVLVSGGFDYFTGIVATKLGLQAEYANRLEIQDGLLTGRVVKPVQGRRAKYDTLVAVATEMGIPLTATLAVGDGANDLDMLQAAGLGIAYRAKAVVAERARWRVEHGDLTVLLYAQGYRAEQIVAEPAAN
jgi:phosphoserine phosphatase